MKVDWNRSKASKLSLVLVTRPEYGGTQAGREAKQAEVITHESILAGILPQRESSRQDSFRFFLYISHFGT